MPTPWCLGLNQRRRYGVVRWGRPAKRRAGVRRAATGFFAESGEFVFVEAFVVFLEDRLRSG